jgi:DNA ligase-1
MDGELICGQPHGDGVFNRTSSAIMSRGGAPKFTYWVFDALTNTPTPFAQRLDMAKHYADSCGAYVQHVGHRLIRSPDYLLEYEAEMLLTGYEGIMIRDPNGPYKQGRATLREGSLLKLKRFEDGEALVIGFVEKEHNDNELTKDELGRAKRSSHKEGKRAADTLGALVVQDVVTGTVFNIGTGFSEVVRADIWNSRGTSRSILDRTVKYRFQSIGVKDAPRFPVFLGVREEGDM